MRRSAIFLTTLLMGCANRPLDLPEPGRDFSAAPGDMAAADLSHLDAAVAVDRVGDLAPDLLTECTVEPVILGAPLSSATPLMEVWVVALGDFNEDGHLDAATAGSDGTSYLAFGDGAGRFGQQMPLPRGLLAAADVNRDGHVDLVYADGDGDGGVNLALGRGDGTFGTPTQFPFGNSFVWFGALAVGDVNGDGKLDIASTYSASQGQPPTGLAVLLGNGDGTFGAAQLLPTVLVDSGNRNQLSIGDVDGDGRADLVLSQGTGLQLYLGHGDGTLEPGVTLVTAPIEQGFALADLNGDHVLDLVVPDDDQDTLSVLLGRGDGTFATTASYPVNTPPLSVLVADLNSDGHPDVTVIGRDFAMVLGGNGDGTLTPGPLFNCAGGMYCAPAIGDINGDGKLDLLVAAGDGLRTFRGLGSNRQFDSPVWPSPSPFAQPGEPLLLADLDGDQIGDVISGWRELAAQRGRPDGSLAPPQPILLPAGVTVDSVTAADFNGDGLVDLVLAMDGPTFGLLLLPGRGDGTFSPSVALPALSVFPQYLAAGDFDGDGLADLVFVDYRDNVGIAYGHGDGTFTAPVTYATDRSALQITVGDLDGDGRSDLVAATFTDALHTIVYSFLGRADRQLLTPISQLIELTDGVSQLALGDLDGDGVLDLALTGRGSYVMRGSGDGTFTGLTQLAPNFAQQIAIGDINGDGRADVVTGNPVCLFIAGCDGALHPGDCYFTYGSTPLLLSPPAPGAPPNLIIGTGTVTVVRNETR